MTDPRELAERLREHAWSGDWEDGETGLPDPFADDLRSSAAALDALADERGRLREVLILIDITLYSHIAETGSPIHRIKDESGVWHEGPGAEICLKVLRALQGVARAALKKGDET